LRTYATYLPAIQWVLIGPYKDGSKMGGCDCMSTIDEMKQAIRSVVECTPTYYAVAFEGMMISTITSTFYNYLLELEQAKGIQPLFVILRATAQGCFKRIMGRGTMKEGLKLESLEAKCATVLNGAAHYDQRYVAYMNVDGISIRRMLPTFLYLVGDMDLLKSLSGDDYYGEPDRRNCQRHI
jgi:hypothetical protein